MTLPTWPLYCDAVYHYRLIDLIYNLARHEQMPRLKLLLSEPEATNCRLKSEA